MSWWSWTSFGLGVAFGMAAASVLIVMTLWRLVERSTGK